MDGELGTFVEPAEVDADFGGALPAADLDAGRSAVLDDFRGFVDSRFLVSTTPLPLVFLARFALPSLLQADDVAPAFFLEVDLRLPETLLTVDFFRPDAAFFLAADLPAVFAAIFVFGTFFLAVAFFLATFFATVFLLKGRSYLYSR